MKATVLKVLSVVITVATAAYIDRSIAAKERREHFIESYHDPVELEHIREGLQTLHTQQKQDSKTVPQDVQNFSQKRRQDQQSLDQNANDSLSLSISANNEGLEEFLYQSDILLTPDQIDQMISSGNFRSKRQAAIGTIKKWDKTKPIFYTFDPSISAASAEIFRLGANFWTNNTCLNIVESSSTPHIRVFFGNGCYSYVGFTGSTSQDLSLGSGCAHFGIATHELAHALGFWHEQSRHDRDSYITVDTSNMDDFYLYNWGKESTATNDNYGLPYDWGSIMHYGESATKGSPIFAIAGDSIYQSTMGCRSGPSFKDLYEMNIHYNCMCSSGATCQNGGFPHPRNCSSCICPTGFGGATCNQLQEAENGAASIGAVLTATECYQSLSAKTGDPTKILQRAQTIHWHITAPAGMKVEISIETVTGQCNVGCAWGSLDIKVRNFDLVGSRFCCASDVAANPKLISVDNFAIVSLYSQAYEHSFTLKYRYIDPSSPNVYTCTDPTATTTTTTTTTAIVSTPTTTTTTSLPTTTTNGSCVDVFDDCQRYHANSKSICYENNSVGAWMWANCAKFCEVCDRTTLPTTARPQTNDTCVDIFDDCPRYSASKEEYCTNTGEIGAWMVKNCAKYCDICTTPTPTAPTTTTITTTTPSPTTTTASGACVNVFDDCQRYHANSKSICYENNSVGAWMWANCAKFCEVCDRTTLPTTARPQTNETCVDVFDDCPRYSASKEEYCTNTGEIGAWMVKNCAKYCDICTATPPTTTSIFTTPPPTKTTTTTTPPSTTTHGTC